MSFDYKPHIMKLKGKEYLPVAARIAWLRSEHPGAHIEAELVTLDLDAQLAVFRATVVIPETGARAVDYGSETAKDFDAYIEKASTKAIGRAIAALGYGTLMALELDEGERVVDSPAAARNGGGAGATVPPLGSSAATKPAATAARAAARAVTAPVPPTGVTAAQPAQPAPVRQAEPEPTRAQEGGDGWPPSAADWTGDQLRIRIEATAGVELKTGQAWKALARAHGVPEPTSAAELGSQTWLLGLYQALRAQEYAARIARVEAAPQAEEQVTHLVAEALALRDRRQITAQQYGDLCQIGEARKAELSGPLLSGPRAQVAS